MKDYHEMFLKEKLSRLRAESEFLILRHEKAMKEHEKTEAELKSYVGKKVHEALEAHKKERTAEAEAAKPKKRGRPRKKK